MGNYKIGKEFSVGYQKFIMEVDGVTDDTLDMELQRMDDIGIREVENMAHLASQSKYNTKDSNRGNYGKKQPPKQHAEPTEKGFGSKGQWSALEKMGVDTSRIKSYDDIQAAFKNPAEFGGTPKEGKPQSKAPNNPYNAQKNVHGVSTTEKQRKTLVDKMGVDIDKIETKEQVQDAFKNPGNYQ